MHTFIPKSILMVVLTLAVLYSSGQTVETIQDSEAIAQVIHSDYILHESVKCRSGKDKPCPMKFMEGNSIACNCENSSMLLEHNDEAENQLPEEERLSLLEIAHGYFDAEKVSIMSFAIIELDTRFYLYYVYQKANDKQQKEVLFTMKE